jgi:excinuclease ABC subunit B
MIGRAARNVNAKVLLYADEITPAMKRALDESDRRRTIQLKYNTDHGITPQTVKKSIRRTLDTEVKARRTVQDAIHATEVTADQTEIIRMLEEEMIEAAKNLEFERAAQLRDKVNELKGAPVVKSGNSYTGEPEEREGQKIWQPKTKGRPKRAAK